MRELKAPLARLYWLLVALLVGFGGLALFSIGAPFLLLGITLALLAPVRRRPRVFWPALAAVIAFIVGYTLVAPLDCISTVQLPGAPGFTKCRRVLGPDYIVPVGESPTYLWGLVAAFLAATASAAGTWVLVGRQAG